MLVTSGMSLMYKTNNIGPSTDPCGIPLVTSLHSDFSQMDIHALQEWSDKWLLCFHPEKCKAMRIGKSRIEQMDYTLKDKC
jgi:hypothetical protein